MPLIHGKSDAAFKENLKTEVKAGTPMKQGLAIAYNIKKRANKMAHGGMAHCAHGGPAYCNAGCYDEGGEVQKEAKPEMTMAEKVRKDLKTINGEDQLKDLFSEKMAKGGLVPAEAAKDAIEYEKDRDEVMDEEPNMPRLEMPNSMDSEESIEEGDMESADEPMKMAMGGMLKPKNIAKNVMKMAKGGMVNSEDSVKAGMARTAEMENHSGGGMDNEDIDVAWTTPHDDNLSSEGDYPLMEEEGYEEGHQAKMRRKGGLLERVMAKIHSR